MCSCVEGAQSKWTNVPDMNMRLVFIDFGYTLGKLYTDSCIRKKEGKDLKGDECYLIQNTNVESDRYCKVCVRKE